MKTSVFVLTQDLSKIPFDIKGCLLPPAVQATALAKYSRSPLSMKNLVAEITNEDAEAFQAKWGVTYGHSSVAELASVPYCFEGVSIIASKFLEKYQRGAYSEKSTRYQKFDASCWIEPAGAPPDLREAANVLYDAYQVLEKPVQAYMARLMPDQPERVQYARAFDSLRYLLPAGSGTNLAAVFNSRDARYVMSDLLGSDLPELQALGEMMTGAARDLAPVFAMGVKPNQFELPIRSLEVRSSSFGSSQVQPFGAWTINSEDHENDFWVRVGDFYGMDEVSFDRYMKGRGKQGVPAVFKTVPIGFDILMDYGAFRDIQRHRRCEQFIEPLSTRYGFALPEDLQGTEFEVRMKKAMQLAHYICKQLAQDGVPGSMIQYALPLGTLHRSAYQMDLAECYYITELRTQPQGHLSYRRVAWEMVEVARKYYSSLMPWNKAIKPDTIGAHT